MSLRQGRPTLSSASRWLWPGGRRGCVAGNLVWPRRCGSRCASACWSVAISSGMSAGTAVWTAEGVFWREVGRPSSLWLFQFSPLLGAWFWPENIQLRTLSYLCLQPETGAQHTTHLCDAQFVLYKGVCRDKVSLGKTPKRDDEQHEFNLETKWLSTAGGVKEETFVCWNCASLWRQ